MSAVTIRTIVGVNGPMKRGRAVALGRVHVDAAPDERLHGGDIAPLDGVDQPVVAGCREQPERLITIVTSTGARLSDAARWRSDGTSQRDRLRC